MRLYAGPSTHFIRESAHNQIAEKLKSAFFQQYRFEPSPGEVGAWRNSLRATAQILEEGGLRDHGILLEYQLPLTSKRLDCMVCGRDGEGRDRAVIVELKQWERCHDAVGDKMVLTWVGGAEIAASSTRRAAGASSPSARSSGPAAYGRCPITRVSTMTPGAATRRLSPGTRPT